MKKTYKVKSKNKRKLKSYLKNEPISKGSRRSSGSQHHSSKRSDIQ
jgi:hypothetical protein